MKTSLKHSTTGSSGFLLVIGEAEGMGRLVLKEYSNGHYSVVFRPHGVARAKLHPELFYGTDLHTAQSVFNEEWEAIQHYAQTHEGISGS